MDGSFFELVTRYSQRPHHDPGENRLTAVLTATLQQRPSLARDLLNRLLPQLTMKEEPRVETQTTARLADGGHAFLDMEITTEGPPRTIIWVEVKLTSGESGPDQFEKCQATLAGKSNQSVLIILAPTSMRADLGGLSSAREWRPNRAVSPHWISWEDLYEALQELLDQLTDAWTKWAVGDLLKYLEMEGLKPVPVTRAHVSALGAIAEAEKALLALIANVEQGLTESFGQPDRRDWPRDRYYELRYPPAKVDDRENWSGDTYFAWGFENSSIFAGIFTPAHDGPFDGMSPAAIESWRASFGSGDWERPWESETEYWVWKVTPLDRVVREAGESIDQQANVVTGFVRGTWDKIATSVADRTGSASN